MHLNNRARDLLDKYSAGMAQQFGARDTSRYFSLNDPQENALRLALLESVDPLVSDGVQRRTDGNRD